MEFVVSMLFLIFTFYVIFKPDRMPYLLGVLYILRCMSHTFGINFAILSLKNISMYVGDITIAAMIVILVMNVLKNRAKRKLFGRFLLILMLFISVSMMRGLLTHGLINEFTGDVRKFFYFLIPVIYFYNISIAIPREKLIGYIDKVMNVLFLFLAVCWYFTLVSGIYITPFQSLRVIGSDYSIVVCMYALWCIYNDLFLRGKAYVTIRTGLFLLVIVILQHNSVWIATFVGCFVIFLLKYIEIIVEKPLLFFQIIALIGLVLIIITFFPNTTLVKSLFSTSNKFNDIGTAGGTFGDRKAVWTALIASLQGKEWLFGKVFGSGYYVWIKGSTVYWTVSPHSGYIEGLMRIGLVGMFFMVGIMGILLKKAVVNKENYFAVVLIVTIMIYWIPYSYTLECGTVIGAIANILINKYPEYIGSAKKKCNKYFRRE